MTLKEYLVRTIAKHLAPVEPLDTVQVRLLVAYNRWGLWQEIDHRREWLRRPMAECWLAIEAWGDADPVFDDWHRRNVIRLAKKYDQWNEQTFEGLERGYLKLTYSHTARGLQIDYDEEVAKSWAKHFEEQQREQDDRPVERAE